MINSVARMAATKCSNRRPSSFAPLRANCHASMPVASVGRMKAAATDTFRYAAPANCDSRLPRERTSNPTPMMNNAIGKWMSTTCCACFSRTIVRKSKGLTIADFAFLKFTPDNTSPKDGGLLHDQCAFHVWMDGADVVIGTFLPSFVAPRRTRLNYARIETRLWGICSCGMRRGVFVLPFNGFARMNGYGCRLKREILDLDRDHRG